MMKAVVAALLSAATVIPVAAMAQDASLREAFRQRMEARGARPAGERAVRVDARADAQAGSGWQRPGRGDRPDRGARPDRPDRVDRPAGGWQRPDAPRSDPRTSADPRDGRPVWTERNWRGRSDARRDRDWQGRDDRRRDGNGRRDWNRDRGWNGGAGWNGAGWNGGGWNRGGRDWSWDDRRRDGNRGWNRDWRRDSRYDWNRYRTANRAAFRLPRYYAPFGWNQGYRRFGLGVTLSSVLFAQDYWIGDPYSFRLPDPYGPYRWVRYYDDALLVDVETGQVVDAEYGVFW